MRILQVFNQYRYRGGEEAWVEEIPSLLGESAEVDELRFHSDDWLKEGAPSKLRQALLMGDNPTSRKQLRAHVERFQPDVLLFHNVIPVGSLGLFFEAKELGLPVLNYIHNFRPFSPNGTMWTNGGTNNAALHGNYWPEIVNGSWQGSRLKTAVLTAHLTIARSRGLLDCIDQHLAISQFMKDRFIEAGVPDQKITVLRHCLSEPNLDPSTHEEKNYYLFLGRLVAEKGPQSLIEAWKILAEKLGVHCPDLIIAGSGPDDSKLKEQAQGSGYIKFLGFVSGTSKLDLIKNCRAMMAPSIWWEPLGLTPYEAYTYSKPVIASKSGGLTETVHEGKTGWLHQPGNPEDIARVVLDAENLGAVERIRRGKEGMNWLHQNANPATWRKTFLQICTDLCNP